MESVHGGHRQRMRNRLSKIGGRGMETYELLEMLLYNTIPLRDTNPIAKALLGKFGSLNGVLSATKEELMSVEGVGEKSAELILAVGDMLPMCASEMTVSSRTFESYDHLGEYLVEYFEGMTEETVVMLSFDNSMKLLSIDEIYRKNYSSGGVHAEAFMNVAIHRGASLVVIAHNHSYGSVFNTEGYRQTNMMIAAELANAAIDLLEVYVVIGSRYQGTIDSRTAFKSKNPAVERFIRSKGGSYVPSR